MARFVILVARGTTPLPPPPGSEWASVLSSQRVSVWLKNKVGPATRSVRLADGVCIGDLHGAPKNVGALQAAWGGYVAVADTGAVQVSRDPSGRLPLYWARASRAFVLASHVEDFASYDCEGVDIDWTCLTAHLLSNATPGHRTGFTGILEVLPGERLSFEGGQVESHAVWTPRAHYAHPMRSVSEARRALRNAVEDSVTFWSARYRRVSLDLSGGLDSSMILALLARTPDPPAITCLNSRIEHTEGDERAFAQIAADAAGVPLLEIQLHGGVTDYSQRALPALQPRPTLQLRGTGMNFVAASYDRQAGSEAYFTGRGGDHVFFNSTASVVARDYLLQTGHVGGWLRIALRMARLSGKPLVEVVRETFKGRRAAADLDTWVFNRRPLVTADAADTVRAEDMTHPWVLEAIEQAPAGKALHVYFLAELQRHYDRMGRAEVIDEVHPLISQPVIEAALRTPSYMFCDGDRLRGLQRQAFADLLPPAILERRTKGATTSHSIRVFAHNLAYLRTHLLDGELVREGLLDPAKLEAVLTPTALLDGRVRPALMECVSAQLWIEQARAYLETMRGYGPRRAAGS